MSSMVRFACASFNLFRESACLFCAFPPMVFVVDKPVHGFAPHCSATTPRHPVFSIALSASALQDLSLHGAGGPDQPYDRHHPICLEHHLAADAAIGAARTTRAR